jgi:hypothetical protein
MAMTDDQERELIRSRLARKVKGDVINEAVAARMEASAYRARAVKLERELEAMKGMEYRIDSAIAYAREAMERAERRAEALSETARQLIEVAHTVLVKTQSE